MRANRNRGRHVIRFQSSTAATGRVHENGVFASQPGWTHIFRSTRSEPLGPDRRLGRSVVRLSIPVCYGTARSRHRSSRPTNPNCRRTSVLYFARPCFARNTGPPHGLRKENNIVSG